MSDTQATGDVAVETTAADSADGSTAAATGVKDATDASDTTTTTEATSDTASDASTENTATATEETEQTEPSDADVASKDADGTEDDDAEDTPAGEKSDKPSRVRQLEREGEVAADFLETLLDIADLDGDIDVDVDGDRAAVAIVDSEDGRVPRRLIGQDGKVLEALQELTRLAVQAATGERSRLMLDVAGFRADRRAALVSIARDAIEEVRGSGERKPLEAMTAFERKVVHDEVVVAGLTSESEGAEPNRHVVILPA